MGHARALVGLEHIEQQLFVAKEIIEKQLSVRATEELIKQIGNQKQGSTPKAAKSNELPTAYKRIEDQIASHLSTKVKLDRKKNGKGTIVLEFYNDNDLERILDKMNL
jgi:ParB family chromosome partitioning protein